MFLLMSRTVRAIGIVGFVFGAGALVDGQTLLGLALLIGGAGLAAPRTVADIHRRPRLAAVLDAQPHPRPAPALAARLRVHGVVVGVTALVLLVGTAVMILE